MSFKVSAIMASESGWDFWMMKPINIERTAAKRPDYLDSIYVKSIERERDVQRQGCYWPYLATLLFASRLSWLSNHCNAPTMISRIQKGVLNTRE